MNLFVLSVDNPCLHFFSLGPVTADSKSSALRLPDRCDLQDEVHAQQWPLDPLRPKPAVLAYKVTREAYTGCFHPPDQSGSDVYVIDLGRADNDTHGAGSHFKPVVDISMKPEDTRGGLAADRNLTLILVSQVLPP